MANPKLALATFIEMDPKVGEWIKRLSKKSENAAMGYASQLHIYWTQFLSKKFSSLEDWVNKVKADSRSEEYDVQTRSAKEVEEWALTRTSERTGRPLGLSARSFYFSSVRSYLEFRLGDKALTDY